MGRAFQVFGETLVKVAGNATLAVGTSPGLWELGLADEGGVKLYPRFYHQDVRVDDYGPNVPAEVLWQLAEMSVRMTLVNYDADVLQNCWQEAMCGNDAMLAGAGTPLGGGKPLLVSGNHYVGLFVANANGYAAMGGNPAFDEGPTMGWHFPSAYLSEQPFILPLGTEKTAAVLTWRAIPYRTPLPGGSTLSASGGGSSPVIQEITSSGACVWNYSSGLTG